MALGGAVPKRAGVVLDLITLRFLHSYLTRPMHVMGLAGLFCMALGFVSLLLTVWMKQTYGTFMTGNPLLLLSALLELIGVQFIGMGLILNLMADTGKKLSELVAELPAYHIVKEKYDVPRERLPKLTQDLLARWPDAKVNRVDGLRLDWEDRWVHVRPSNTEPIVRVIAEALRRDEAERLCRDIDALLST